MANQKNDAMSRHKFYNIFTDFCLQEKKCFLKNIIKGQKSTDDKIMKDIDVFKQLYSAYESFTQSVRESVVRLMNMNIEKCEVHLDKQNILSGLPKRIYDLLIIDEAEPRKFTTDYLIRIVGIGDKSIAIIKSHFETRNIILQ